MSKKEITVKQYLRKYAMYSALALALSTGLYSCVDNTVKVDQYDNIETRIVQNEAGEYKVESEEISYDTVSTVIVIANDGTEQRMSFEEAKLLFSDKDPMEGYEGEKTPDSYYQSHNSNLWFVMFWSSYGLHLGRPWGTPIYGGYYSSPAVYSRAQTTSRKVVSSRKSVTVPRGSNRAPIKASSGYGKSTAKGYGGSKASVKAKASAARAKASSSSRSSSGSRSSGG